MALPLLENGYYYHFKHADNGDINNYAYEEIKKRMYGGDFR